MKPVKIISISLSAILLFVMLAGCVNSNAIEPAPGPARANEKRDNTPAPVTPAPSPDKFIVAEPDDEPDEPAETPEPTPEPEPEPTVTVTFAGDVLIDMGTKNLYAAHGFDGIFSEDAYIKENADLLMVNLEQPFSERGEPMEDKQWTFRGDPRHVRFLSELGVDIVSLANNHTLDFGTDAFLDTLEYLKNNNIDYVGGGVDLKEASDFKIYEVNGIKIAFLAASNVLPSVSWYAKEKRPGLFSTYDPRELVGKITEASEVADHVVVYVHWGTERAVIPEEWQREKARRYIDAGASCVIGSHPHVLQGLEYYNGKPIVYSLGDFIFPTGNKDTMTATVTFGEEVTLTLRPYMIRSLKTVPATESKDRNRILQKLREVSFNVRIGDDFSVSPLAGEHTAVSKTEEESDPMEEYLRGMSLEEKVGQMFICAFSGTEQGVKAIEDYHLGGVILFSGNIQNTAQVKTLIADLQKVSALPLFVSIDEEGGKVSRLGALNIKKLPDAAKIGRTGDGAQAYERGVAIAKTIKELGFNLNFAPVADINTNDRNTVIGSRAFSPDPEIAAVMVREFVKGLQSEGIAATLKHFPGHGDTKEDSHYGLAFVTHDMERLNEKELVPFKAGIDAGAAFVMSGHISAPNVTGGDDPATFSEKILTGLLREQLGFNGVVITDALNMGAIADNFTPGETAVKAILAGADILLMPQDTEAAYNAALAAVRSGAISENRIDESVKRILETKLRFGIIKSLPASP